MKVPLLRGLAPCAAAGVLAAALSGCTMGLASPAVVAGDFDRAISSGDFSTACSLLTPAAVQEVETGSGEDCESALESLGVPAGGAVVHVEAWGRAAIAEMEQDTLFLARTGETWAVRAAGCTPVPEAPYDCIVTGG
ncbi:hypothetical protein [Naasia sp. SYSU D00948]|uniref:hypothetical protein n=1 Tax=Naasia sp. SYSU D00948 TaxID=2817379 RepID=UPI001B30B4FB|nr:hypothetical protein [Naasia sp. SYSU D00948]